MIPEERASSGEEEEKENMRKLGQESKFGSFRHSFSLNWPRLKDYLTKCHSKLQKFRGMSESESRIY